jgi:hypothetical protein
MRTLSRLGLLALIAAGSASAHAADFGMRPLGDYARIGARAGEIIVYDYEPGVRARAYWSAPWRHRHYYPVTGKPPLIGRDEDLSNDESNAPAESYYREWSTTRLNERPVPADDRPLLPPVQPRPGQRFDPLPPLK